MRYEDSLPCMILQPVTNRARVFSVRAAFVGNSQVNHRRKVRVGWTKSLRY